MLAKLFSLSAILVLSFCLACQRSSISTEQSSQPVTPKDGNYNGKGKVTKINPKLGSVELDHETIEGLMPAMRMEFYVSDKSLIDSLKVEDEVDFVIEYKQGTEKIVQIKKVK